MCMGADVTLMSSTVLCAVKHNRKPVSLDAIQNTLLLWTNSGQQ